jgi:hypothetical protein
LVLLPQVPLQEFGTPVGVAVGVAVGVWFPVGVGVGVWFPVGVGVGEPVDIVNVKLQVLLFSAACGILEGTFGATGWFPS